jgi:hypothetical protein
LIAKPKSKPLNPLTARAVETIKKEGYHHDGGGLYLRVWPNSPDAAGLSRSWLFRYTVAGNEHWIGLGSAGIVSLVDARSPATSCALSVTKVAIRWPIRLSAPELCRRATLSEGRFTSWLMAPGFHPRPSSYAP